MDEKERMIQALNPMVQQSQGFIDAAKAAPGVAYEASGIPDALKVLRGQMSPAEQQDLFAQQLTGLGPLGKAGGAAVGKIAPELAALLLMPKKLGVQNLFEIVHDKKGPVGYMMSHQQGPNRVHIDDIASTHNKYDAPTGWNSVTQYGARMPQAHTLGTKEIMSLLPQIKSHYPEADHITGWRASGARAEAGKKNPIAYVNLPEKSFPENTAPFAPPMGRFDPNMVQAAPGASVNSNYRTLRNMKPAEQMEMERLAKSADSHIQQGGISQDLWGHDYKMNEMRRIREMRNKAAELGLTTVDK